MLHNKYYEILKEFSGDFIREIYGRELVNKIKISQKNIALTLKELENKGILKSKMKGNIKFYSLNLKNSEMKDYMITVEFLKKTQFFSNHQKIAHIFDKDNRIVGIFGSYAKNKQKKDSDLDLFIVGKRDSGYQKKGKLYDLNISIKYFTEKQFIKLLAEKNNLIKEILQNHILIFNIERFIKLVWGYYYSFS